MPGAVLPVLPHLCACCALLANCLSNFLALCSASNCDFNSWPELITYLIPEMVKDDSATLVVIKIFITYLPFCLYKLGSCARFCLSGSIPEYTSTQKIFPLHVILH